LLQYSSKQQPSHSITYWHVSLLVHGLAFATTFNNFTDKRVATY